MSVVTGGCYHSYVIGRVRFVLTDSRSYRSANGDVDNSSKTMLGTTQKTWFKNEITAAKNAGQAVVWVQSNSWIAPAGDNSNDNWGGYTTERQELVDHFTAQDMLSSIIYVHGDMHAAALDSGTHSPGGIPVMCGAPENQTSSSFPTFQGQYDQGPLEHSGTRLMGFGGMLVFQDAGDGKIVVTMQIVSEAGIMLLQTVELKVPAVVPGSLSSDKMFITHNIDVINFDAFPEDNIGQPNA